MVVSGFHFMIMGSAISKVRFITDSEKLGLEGGNPNLDGKGKWDTEGEGVGEGEGEGEVDTFDENNKHLISFLGISVR